MREKKETVSVIIPVKNSKYLESAIISALTQKECLEVIVVADGKDVELNTLKSQKVSIIRNKQNLGPGETRNVGFLRAKGKYLVFLDSDDYFEERYFEKSIQRLKSCGNDCVGVLSYSNKKFEKDVNIIQKISLIFMNFIKDIFLSINYFFNEKRLRKDFVFLCQISHLFFKREKILGKKFNLDYKYCEDWKFVLDVQKGGHIIINPIKLINFRYSNSSYTLRENGRIVGKSQYYEKFHKEMKHMFSNMLGVKLFSYYSNYFLLNKS